MKSRVGCFSINVIVDSEEHDLYLSMLSIQGWVYSQES